MKYSTRKKNKRKSENNVNVGNLRGIAWKNKEKLLRKREQGIDKELGGHPVLR